MKVRWIGGFWVPGGGGRGGARMGSHLAPHREPPKSGNVKKPLVLVTNTLSFTHGYIVKRGHRRGRAGARPGAKSRLPFLEVKMGWFGGDFEVETMWLEVILGRS